METGGAAETLSGRVQVVTEGDREGVGVIGQPEGERGCVVSGPAGFAH